MRKVMFYSTCDLSVNNGQGIYSRKILEVLIDECAIKNLQLIIMTPKPVSDLKILQKQDVIYLPRKLGRNRFYHVYAQLIVFFKILFMKDLTGIIYSVKPMQFGLVMLNCVRKVKNVLLLEGLSSKSISKIGLSNLEQRLGIRVFSLLARRSVVVYSAYDSAGKWMGSLGARNIKNTPCGVDTTIFYPCKKAQKNSAYVIGYVGSFRAVHRLDLLIDVATVLDVEVHLYGIGQEVGYIEKLVRERGIEHRVFFFGNTDQNRLREGICSCDLLWGYTDINHWGVPIKVYEYLACERPVIVSQRLEFEFISELKYGIVIREQKPLIIINAITNFMVNKGLKIYSYEYIKKNHNWCKFKDCLEYII